MDQYESRFKQANDKGDIEIKLPSKNARAMADDVNHILVKYFGIRDKDEYDILFYLVDNYEFYEETCFMDCLVQVMKQYYS